MVSNKNSITSWIICLSVSLFFFYEFIEITMLDTISSSLMKDLNINAIQLANISACYYFSNILFLIPAGLALDRFNTKILTCLSILLSVIGILLLSNSKTVSSAEFARLISGISGAFCFLCCIRFASEWFTFEKLSFVIAIIITIAFIGGIVSHVPFAISTSLIGWRKTLNLFALIGILIFFINLNFLKSDAVKSTKNNFNLKEICQSVTLVISNKYTWIGSLYTTLLNLPVVVLGSLWSGLYFNEIQKFPSLSAAFITSGIFIGLIIGSPITGYFAKNELRIKKIMFIGSLASFLLISIFIFYSGKSIPLLLTLFILLGFFSSTQSVGYPIVINNNNASLTSLATSVTSIVVLGGGTCFKILFGALLDLNWNGLIENNIRIYSHANFRFALFILPTAFLASFFLAKRYGKLY